MESQISWAVNGIYSSSSAAAAAANHYVVPKQIIMLENLDSRKKQPTSSEIIGQNHQNHMISVVNKRKPTIDKKAAEDAKRRRLGVFLGLKMTFEENFWTIKKKLTNRDVNDLCCLFLSAPLVEAHIFPFMDPDLVWNCKAERDVKFAVFDADTNTEHEIMMKKSNATNSFVLLNRWRQDFVVRRNLAADDLIGLFYHPPSSSIYFSVLKTAFATAATVAATSATVAEISATAAATSAAVVLIID